jgi:NAD(P)H-hydrate epimerase
MENAGRGVAGIALRELGGAPFVSRVAVFAGKGNNGGDGYVAARYLQKAGIVVTVYSLCGFHELRGDAAANASDWKKMDGAVEELLSIEALKAAGQSIEKSDIVIDAIFGTGLSDEVTGTYAEAIRLINRFAKKIISIDIPSGINATTGAVLGEAVRAHVTATMAMPKLGLLLFPGRAHAGRVEVVDIGVPKEAVEDPSIKWNLSGPPDMSRILKPRKADSHKSSHGHLLILAGSPGMTGAAYMCGTAAMRSGAGLVTFGVPKSLHEIMEVKTAEVMTTGLPETAERRLGAASYEEIKRALSGKTALVIGPGAGTSEELLRLIELILKGIKIPVVIDADGLNSFAPRIESLKGLKSEVVLTPHPGEMSRLLKIDTSAVQADRVAAAERLVQLSGATVVLKGHGQPRPRNRRDRRYTRRHDRGLPCAGLQSP